MENTTCSSCHNTHPQSATFCPFCGVGASTPPPYNNRFEANLADQSDELEFEHQPGIGPRVKLFAGVAITGAVIAGIFAGSWLADLVNRPAEPAAPAPIAAVEESPAHVHPEISVTKNAAGGFDVMNGAEVLHTVSTSAGSRYPNLDERMRSVAVRFKHVQNKQDGRYAARLATDHYEVVWAGPEGDFRLLDVTNDDVAGEKGGADFAANLLVDRLNASLPARHNS